MIRTIGIDLGTTNTVAAQMKKGKPREIHNQRGEYITPSAVALSKKGELLVGDDAGKRESGIVMSFKRDMGTDKKIQFNKRIYTPMEMSALVLRHVKKDVEVALGELVSRAVITVPAWFSERAIVETREAGIMAGFFVLRTFSEPMAAALAYGIDREGTEPKVVLVYDLGRQEFDVSILMVSPGSFAALDHEGDVYLGGDDFDTLIVNHICERLRKERGLTIPDDPETRHVMKLACERAKIDLSSMEIAEVHLPSLGKEKVEIDIDITRHEFESMLMPWLAGPRQDGKKSTMEHVRQAIAKSALTPDKIDNILLVGGSTQTPLVLQLLGQEFGEGKVLTSANPALCVAYGAAIETALVHEVDCPQCHHKNPLDAIKCEKCSASLVGEEKIDCPVCFLPSPAAARNCWKCSSELRIGSRTGVPLSEEREPDSPIPKRRETAPEVALSRCAACGRPMGKSARKGERWCATCLDIMARFLTASLYQVNKLGEGEATLSHLLEQTKSPVWQYYLGLVQAQAGKLDSAIELLKSLLGSNDEHSGLRGTLSSLLTTHAFQRIKDRDYQSAVQDLSLAAELEPRNQAIAQSLSLARGIEAFLQIDAEAGGEALAKLIQTWHKMQLRQPDNYSIVHNLAILSYRLASEAEEEAREKIADNAWRDTVANWSLLLNADAFWEQWIERESSLYRLNASVDDISHLRLGLRERLLEDFRAYRIRYGEANNPNASRRHREYEVLFLLEIKTAEAMRKVLDLLHQKALSSSISLPCGPIMLQTLGLFSSAQEMVAQARNHRLSIDEVNKLENCLSPAGRVEVLVETHWLEQAEAELDELLEKSPTRPELLSYMVRVLKEQGMQLAAVGKFEEAMKKLEKGLHYAKDDRDLEDTLVTACLDEAKRLSEGNKKADIEKAMKILTRGRKLVPKNSQLKENLATYYVRRGIIEGNNDKWVAAWKDLIRALELDRNNGLALRNIEVVANNHSVALANADSRSEAIEVVTKALNYLDSPRLRDLLRRIRGW